MFRIRLRLTLTRRNRRAERRLKRIRKARPRFDPQAVSVEELLQAIDEGRP